MFPHLWGPSSNRAHGRAQAMGEIKQLLSPREEASLKWKHFGGFAGILSRTGLKS